MARDETASGERRGGISGRGRGAGSGEPSADDARKDDPRGEQRQLTHRLVDAGLAGEPVEIGADRATVRLTVSRPMAADERGLAHGGFVFGLADHAAMLAVNHPNVVLGRADAKFLVPVEVGDRLEARAGVRAREGAKTLVEVEVWRGDTLVLTAEMTCFTPDEHVLAG